MTTTKAILEGDTSRFAFGVTFQKDPDDGVGAAREESISWGGLQIWVRGQNLCAHREGDTLVDYAHWYLLPLFEWFSACWDYLLHEERLPLRVAGNTGWRSMRETERPPLSLDESGEDRWETEWQEWWLRHSILASRQGGLFPDVMFRRWRDRIEISWGDRRLAGQPGDFSFLAGEGFRRLPVAEVAEPLFAVLRQAADHLVSLSPDSERLLELGKGLESLKGGRTPTRTPKRFALLTGLGERPERQELWEKVQSQLQSEPQAAQAVLDSGIDRKQLYVAGSCQAAIMFGSVAPTIEEDDAMVLARKLIDLYEPGAESQKLLDLVREEPIDGSGKRPWDQGYRLAEEILEELSLPEAQQEWIDVRRLYEQLGILVDQFQLTDDRIRAVSIAGPEHRPSTLFNTSSPFSSEEAGRRFTLAHELCHILYDRNFGARLAIASGPWAPRDLEARANAFAAMLLMPTDMVRRVAQCINSPLVSVESVREMAKRMQTGFKATLAHLKNLGFLVEEDHDRIEVEFEKGQGVE